MRPQRASAPSLLAAVESGWVVRRYRIPRQPTGAGTTELLRSGRRWTNPDAGVYRLTESRDKPPLATGAIVSVLENAVGALRRLGDAEGGHPEALAFLGDHVGIAAEYLKSGRFASPLVRERLMGAYAQLNQVGGCLAADAERHAVAERYYHAALQAANNMADQSLGAYVMSCMAHYAAYRGRSTAAAGLIAAATERAQAAHPRVQTAVAARASYERAMAGDLSGFRAAAERVDDLAASPVLEPAPDYTHWCHTPRLRASRGFDVASLLVAVREGSVPPARMRSRLLAEAQALLADEVEQSDPARARDDALFTSCLARSQLLMGEPERAISSAEIAVMWLGQVRSRRVRRVLWQFARDLAADLRGGSLSAAERFQERLRVAVRG